MKTGQSSITSLVSAFSRAYHSEFDRPLIFDDYIAKDLISQQEKNMIKENMVQGIQFFNKDIAAKLDNNADKLLKWITQIQLSPTPLARAAYCEKVLLHEMMLGTQQYVILGAGLDTFCFRNPHVKNKLEIFELDHPSTQENKKKRLKDAKLETPDHLHFVSMDFTEKFSYQQLKHAGFDGTKKTFFSLLGVSYYLSKEQLSLLLEQIFAHIPSGSSIVFDYGDEHLFTEKGLSNRVENMVKMALAGGEPMKSCFSYCEMEKMLEKVGLLIFKHLTPYDIEENYFKNRKDYLKAFETIHYIHAVKK
ncbi:class I SAM-dependent methyltransferase [Niallia sp. 01092]|uniref:class I SAM-dependent methyltransferase n=1 Tax=unclassified Niallia TaxID=2837522 RepID=UPI003FD5F461